MAVQVVRPGVGGKGPVVTTELTLAGRYAVLKGHDPALSLSRRIGETTDRDRLTATMAPLLDGPLKISMKCVCCHENGDTAVVRTDWVLNAPDGSVAMAGSSAEVLRHEADGQWRFVIDDATFSSRSEPCRKYGACCTTTFAHLSLKMMGMT